MHLTGISKKINNLNVENYIKTLFEVFFLNKIMLICNMSSVKYEQALNDSSVKVKPNKYLDVFTEQSFFIESGAKFLYASEKLFDEFCNSDLPLDYKLAQMENIRLHIQTLIEIHNRANSFLFPNLIDKIYVSKSNTTEATKIDLSKVTINKKILTDIYKWYAMRKDFFTVLADKVLLYKNDLSLSNNELKKYIENKKSQSNMFRLIHELVFALEAANYINTNGDSKKLIQDLRLLFGIKRDAYASKIANKILTGDNPSKHLEFLSDKLIQRSNASKKIAAKKKST